MGNSIGFRAALSQFGAAGSELATAFVRSPFTGGWKRLVVVGPPVLLVTSGVGALIFAVMNKVIRETSSAIYRNGKSFYNNFYKSRSVSSVPPDRPPERNAQVSGATLLRQFQRIMGAAPQEPSPSTQKVVRNSVPLPIKAAEERNQSLLKLLALVEKLVIDPLVEKQELCQGQLYTKEGLKSWLMNMTLWSLGIAWDQLEAHYVQWQTPPEPTVESIVKDAKAIDKGIGDKFEAQTNQGAGELENQLQAISLAIHRSSLTPQKKSGLMGLYFQLEIILKKIPAASTDEPAEVKELRNRFALAMHRGMANTLEHVVGAVDGWIRVFKDSSTNIAAGLTTSTLIGSGNATTADHSIQALVQDVSSTVQSSLTGQYVVPLWQKTHKEWRAEIERDLKAATGQDDITVYENFMKGQGDEKAFLATHACDQLPTSLVSRIFFMRAVRSMGSDADGFARSTRAILGSVLGHLEPTIVDTLTRAADTVAQVSFQRAVPRVVNYFIELLQCCTTMQNIRKESERAGAASLVTSNRGSDSELKLALKGAGILETEVDSLSRLYEGIAPQISGTQLIRALPPESVHAIVRRSLESPDHEEGWFQTKMVDLKTLLRVRARKYAEDEGTWLYKLLKSHPNGSSTDLMALVQDYLTKLSKIPGLESMMMFISSGLQSFIENKVCNAIQVSLNELTSTGYLSTLIATSVVSGLIAKDEAKWKKNLPVLRLAFNFLQKEEQDQVLGHLKVICDSSMFSNRKSQLEDSAQIPLDRKRDIAAMQMLENNYKAAEQRLAIATKDLVRDSIENHIVVLMRAHEKFKRANELQQFHRVRTLVTYVVNELLKEYVTVEAARDVCIRVLHEALTLLTCQEIIKHWIFTIVDLVIDELKDTSDTKTSSDVTASGEVSSLLDFIGFDQKASLLKSLGDFLGAVETDTSWLSARAWAVSITKQVTAWSPDSLWSRVVEPYRDLFKITPPQLKNTIVSGVRDFGTNENGLSSLIVQGLTKNVADPRV